MGAVRSLNRFKVRALASFFRKVIAVWRTVQEFNCKSKKSRYTDSTKSGKAFLLLAQFMLNYVTALNIKARGSRKYRDSLMAVEYGLRIHLKKSNNRVQLHILL